MSDFQECASCAAKPGAPDLCPACRHNRAVLADVTRERDEAREQRNKAQADVQWMVERAADQKLDGYRELGARCAAAEARTEEYKREVERRNELLHGADEDRKAAEAELERAREALRLEERMAQGFDSEDDLRAARLVADHARRVVLSDEARPIPEVTS